MCAKRNLAREPVIGRRRDFEVRRTAWLNRLRPGRNGNKEITPPRFPIRIGHLHWNPNRKLVLRFWLHTHIGLDIEIHDAYRVVPINVIGFWFLMGIASVWFLIVAWESICRHP